MRVEIRDLVVYRDSFCAVDRVSIAVESGCWMGVVGANGSGKTSLLRALAGRLEARSGSIVVDGTERIRDREWRARHFGFAPDAASLPHTLSGRELLSILASDPPGLEPSDPFRRLRQALDFDRFLDRKIGTLSAGMKQRLAIFCAFVDRPSVVILDEPLNWLDPICAFDTKEALHGLVEGKGLTLVTALHEMTTLVHYCHAGALLSEGRVSRHLDRADMIAGMSDYARFEAQIIEGLRVGANGR